MRYFGKVLALLLFVAVLVTGVSSLLWAMPDQTPSALAPLGAPEAAAQLYAQGDYALSAQAYSQLIDQGYGDIALYFNRGLAHHQSGDTVSALASLRQAAELAPRDAQVRAAVELIEATAPAAAGEYRGEPAGIALAALTRWLTIDELALAALGLWLLLGGAATVGILQKARTDVAPR